MNSDGSTGSIERGYLVSASWLIVGLMLAGCASPGPPRAPSLQLPDPVRDLTVSREGNTVIVRFTLPQRTTDNLPIREAAVRASLCSGPEGSPCAILPALQNVSQKIVPGAAVADRAVTWTETLPPADTTGEPKLLAYRVRLSNLGGKTAGWSEPAYTASGVAPQAVEGLHAEETHSGILLHWQPGDSGADEVLLQRETLTPRAGNKSGNEPVWLISHAQPSGPGANETVDTSAAEDVPFRYIAVRRRTVEVGQQKVELRSAISPAVEITWHNLFPPPAPTGLSAAPFSQDAQFSVDLVWEPVEEPGLKGYIVTRQRIGSDGSALGAAQRLTPTPAALPAFHDVTAEATARYKYDVQAVGHKGTASPPATVIVEPTEP